MAMLRNNPLSMMCSTTLTFFCQEYILKGIVNAALGQEQESREHLKIAQQYFQLVGGSASECDTIPGRQVKKPLVHFIAASC